MRSLSLPLVAVAAALPAFAAPARAPAPRASARSAPSAKPPAPRPPAHVPGPIGVGRVTVEVGPERLLVTTDLTLPRGPFVRSDLEAHVAFGAPGVPFAFDAELCATPAAFLVAPLDASCAALRHEPAYRADGASAFVVGPAVMAGERVVLPASALDRALRDSSMATLRIRALRSLPSPDAAGRREVLVRLGAAHGRPYVLGEIDVLAIDGATIAHADARLCGPNIDETPLAIVTDAPHADGVPPPLAPRSTTDDLCVRVR